jgi:FkbM family methyltransferase
MNEFILAIVSISARLLPPGVKRLLYRLGPITVLIRQILNKISPTGLSKVTLSAGVLMGMEMNLDMQTEKDYWLGTYEADLLEIIQKHVITGWVAYDVGANIGYISLLLAKSVGDTGKVFAFEALPANVERLHGNLALNGLTSRVRIIPRAVSDTSKPVNFLIGPSGAMGKVSGSAGRTDMHYESIEVIGISLDDFVYRNGNPHPQVIKMDIEGGEVLALNGMSQLLKEARPLIFLELHGPEAARVAWNELSGAGYRICSLGRDLPAISSLEALDWKSYLVAVP